MILEKSLRSRKFCGINRYCQSYGWIPEWPKGADCKSVGNAFEGSNPSPSIQNVNYCKIPLTTEGVIWYYNTCARFTPR